MRVKATWSHVLAVTREIDIDEDAFTEWRDSTYGAGADNELALAQWIDQLDTEEVAAVFHDWQTSKPLPSDFELQYSDVNDVEIL